MALGHKERATVAAIALALLPVCTGAVAAPPQAASGQEPQPAASPFDKEWFRVPQADTFIPGYAYVRFSPDASAGVRANVHAAAGAKKVLWESKIVPGLCRVSTTPGAETAVVNAYLDDPHVWYAEPSYAAYPTVIPDDEYWDDLWGMLNCRADLAWDVHTGGADFKIAIIDTGIDYNHEDLATNVWTNPGEIPDNEIDDDGNGYVDDVHGYDFGEGDSDPFDSVSQCLSHGTHVSGIAGAVGNNGIGVVGLNWQCKLVACKTSFPWGGCYGQNEVEALEYAVLVGCRVSNNSYGKYAYSQAMYDMIEASMAYGHVFVASAGNNNLDTDVNHHYPSGYDLPNIISVAAIDVNDQRAEFSNYGATTVDLGAPGVDILSCYVDGYGWHDGTSMSAPHVAGTAGLLFSLYAEMGYRDAVARILNTARPVGDLNGVTVTGGVLDAYAAIGEMIWVDFSYGGVENGTYHEPFNTLGEGLGAAPSGWSLMVKSGATGWTGTINQDITVVAFGGPVIIGQ